MKNFLARAKRIALALFRRKRRERSVVIEGTTYRSRPLTDAEKQRILARLNDE